MEEVWKKVEGYNNYEVSNMGNVRRILNNGYHYKKPRMRKDGYLLVDLYFEGLQKTFLIHRLVALAFLDNPYNLSLVNHKNFIRNDNRVDNLEWCDSKYNTRYSLAKPIKGYNDKIVVAFEAMADVKLIGLDAANICSYLKGRYKNAYGLLWEYITKEEFDKLKTNPKIVNYGIIRLYLSK